jgi:hypothetical protein
LDNVVKSVKCDFDDIIQHIMKDKNINDKRGINVVREAQQQTDLE